MNREFSGLLAIILAYVIWGGFPIYFRQLSELDALELLWVRIMLTAAACWMLLPVRGSFGKFALAWRDRRRLKWGLLAGLLLATNWFSFIWAVTSGNILESSLGYFLCPLVNVVLGRVVQRENLGAWRLSAVLLAGFGVGILILLAERIPLAALIIAATWGSYGLLKKRTASGPIVSLGMETSLLSPLALVALMLIFWKGEGTLEAASLPTLLWLLPAGMLTATPLLLFAFSAHRIQLSTMGMGQYIVPTFHFGLAIFYGEALPPALFLGFGFIWLGLILYTVGSMRRHGA